MVHNVDSEGEESIGKWSRFNLSADPGQDPAVEALFSDGASTQYPFIQVTQTHLITIMGFCLSPLSYRKWIAMVTPAAPFRVE